MLTSKTKKSIEKAAIDIAGSIEKKHLVKLCFAGPDEILEYASEQIITKLKERMIES